MATVAIDFDHTICDSRAEGRPPLPGAKEAISHLRSKGHEVVIFSCNRTKFIEQWMNNNDIRYDRIYGEGDQKPIAAIYIDDRGLRFNGNWNDTLNLTIGYLEAEGPNAP